MHKKILKQALLNELYAPYKNCTLCPLSQTRTQIVFGKGNPDASLLIVGEGPGKDEDEQGLPFVGKSGKLLTKALIDADIPEEAIYITNIVKCRPPNNRPPSFYEGTTCIQALLMHQIQIIQPNLICTLGATATNFMLATKQPLSAVRAKIINSQSNIPLIATFHPAYILRKRSEMENFIKDLLLVKKSLSIKK